MITYLAGFGGAVSSFLTRFSFLIALGVSVYAQAPAPEPVLAASSTANSITLSWNDVTTDEDGFRVRRYDQFAGAFVEIASVGPNVTSFRDTGLLAENWYYYQVASFNATGESSPASSLLQAIPVPAPFPLVISDVTASAMRLTWNDIYSDEDGFRIEYYDESIGTMVPLATVGPNVTTYQDTGLIPGNWYYYEVFAFNSGGDSYRASAFAQTTPSAAPDPLVVTATTGNTISLSWNDAFNDETGFRVKRYDYEIGAMVIIGVVEANVTTYLDTGLSPGQTYFYEVVAYNDGGESFPASASAQATPIPAPEPLTVSAITANTVRLNWNDIYSDEEGFRIERYDAVYARMVVIASVGPNVTTFLDTGLIPGETYYYEVAAFNSGGDSYRASISAQATPTPAPAPLVVEGTTANTISLSWSDISNDEDGFRVKRHDPVTGTLVTIAILPPNVTEYLDTGLQPGNTYSYEVVSFNYGGESYAASVSAQSSPIPSPGPLVVTGVTANTVGLAWNDIYDNEDGFRLKRFDWGLNSLITVATLPANATSYLDAGLIPGETYYYEVVAFNAGGESYSANISAQPTPVPAPNPLVKVSSTATTISLTWNDRYSDEDGFRLERSEDGNVWGVTATLPADQTNYIDVGLVPERFYFYRVAAFNSGGDSYYTDTLSAGATPVPAPDPLLITSVGFTNIVLSWNDIYSDEDGFRIERSSDSVNFGEVATMPANTTNFFDGSVLPNTFYVYRVAAFNSGGASYYSMTANATTLPLPPFTPAGLTATALSQTSVKLTWTDTANNETSFVVERSLDGSSFTAIASLPANSDRYTDESAMANGSNYYRVRASNAGGDSPFSNIASVLTPDHAPAAPTELTANGVSTSQIDLAWVDNSENETAFVIERASDGSSFSAIAILSAGATTFADTGLVESTSYSYRVYAKNSGGPSAASNVAFGTTLAATSPTTPGNLNAVTVSATQINLTWRDNANNETRYTIEARNNGSAFILIGVIGANAQAFSATGLNPNTRYVFRVRAENSIGSSGYAETAIKTFKQ